MTYYYDSSNFPLFVKSSEFVTTNMSINFVLRSEQDGH